MHCTNYLFKGCSLKSFLNPNFFEILAFLTLKPFVLLEGETSNADTEETKEEGKIVFKKPKKRKSEDKSSDKDNKKKFKDKKPKTSSKAVKNSSLLSFGDDEEEEG